MIASRVNLANSASGYCMNSVSECVCVAGWVWGSFPWGKRSPSYKSAICNIRD